MPARFTATLALLTLGALALVGCSGAAESDVAAGDPAADEANTTDEAELRAKKCGGLAGLRCATGYDCLITAHHPDAMGTCKKHVAAASCATMTCPAGQHCMVMGSPAAPMCM